MLVRLTRMGWAVTPVVLAAFVAATVGWPDGALAQSPGKTARVLFVSIQRSDDVPEGVPGRIEEYLKAIIEIDPKIKLISQSREESGEPMPSLTAAPAPVAAAEPAPADPDQPGGHGKHQPHLAGFLVLPGDEEHVGPGF